MQVRLEGMPVLCAAGQAEAANARLPAPCGRYLIIFVDVPEGAIVGRVNRHIRVISPAITHCLRPRTIDQHALAQGHLPRRVVLESASVADARKDICRVGDTVAQGQVALLVHSDTPHPAVHAISRSVGTLLEERDVLINPPDLVPADASDARAGLNCLIRHPRLVLSEIAIRQPERRPLPV